MERVTICWERLFGAADELVHVHEVPVEEVTTRIRLSLAHADEANDGTVREEASVFLNQIWPG